MHYLIKNVCILYYKVTGRLLTSFEDRSTQNQNIGGIVPCTENANICAKGHRSRHTFWLCV